jgi:colanic acid biosynthesis glycosyl transferase WcaI
VLTARSRLLGGTAGLAFERLERHLLRRSDAIVAISDDFVSTLDAAGIRTPRVVVENWAPLDELVVGARHNPWSEHNGLTERPVALYSGTLGIKHDPGHLVRTAEDLRDIADVVVVSEGRGRELLEAARTERALPNLRLFDFVDYDQLGNVLATADVSLVLLEPDAGTFSVPSKVLSYLAAGRAVVAAVPANNLAARTLERSGAGVVVRPGDHAAFAEEVRRLLADPATADRMGKAGRRYAEEHFDIRAIADAILKPI